MKTISLLLPNSLHNNVRKLAQEERISINQLITTAVAEKMSALMTESYLHVRAKRGRRRKSNGCSGKCGPARRGRRIGFEARRVVTSRHPGTPQCRQCQQVEHRDCQATPGPWIAAPGPEDSRQIHDAAQPARYH
jgi:hypothetical protein